MYIEKMEKKSFMCIGWKLCHYPLSGMIYIACIEFYQIMSSGYCHFQQYLKVVGALDNYSLVFVIFINFFRQLKDWVGQVLFLVSCPKGQVEKYVNVEAWWW
jgi:hypothetical protein